MNGTRDIAIRIVNAENSFVEFVLGQIKCTSEQAEKVLSVFKKQRIIKIDAITGQWTVKHGAFLEPDVFWNAIELF